MASLCTENCKLAKCKIEMQLISNVVYYIVDLAYQLHSFCNGNQLAILCIEGDTTKPGLWTMDWTVDWTMDRAFLIEMSCLTVSWLAAWPRIETWAHN